MIKFLRNILGLGPAETFNKSSIQKPITNVKEDSNVKSNIKILPMLVSSGTKTINLKDELVSIFHEREGIYKDIFIAYAMVDEDDLDEDGEPAVSHLHTADKTEEECLWIGEQSQNNLDEHELPFVFWNSTEKSYDFKVLSAAITFFSSEKIMSRKHMLEAHKMLDSDEIYVSIPRKGLIFSVSKNITEDQLNQFFKLHYFIVMDDKKEKEGFELLCEDIFVVKDGEIDSFLLMEELSSLLKNNNS